MKYLSILSLITLLSVFTACTKYEEGPAISLRGAKKKIAGNWRIDSYRVDGADSMWVIQGLHLQGDFRFVPYETSDSPPLRISTIENNTTYGYGGTWGVDRVKGETNINTTLSSYAINGSRQTFNREQAPLNIGSWKVVRLKHRDEMWLETTENGKQYELKFKAI